MRLILAWFEREPEVQMVLDRLREGGHEISYFIGDRGQEKYAPEGAIFHNHYDAWDAKPAPALADEVFPPPSAAEIKENYRLESLVLTMMDKHFDRAPVDERRHIYYRMFAYWSAVLDKIRPDAIVFQIVPHSVYTNILYELARARGIKTIMFEDTNIFGRCVMYREFWHGSDEIRAAISANLARGVTRDDLGEQFQEYWQAQVEQKDRALMWYLKDQKRDASGAGLWRIRMRALRHSWSQGELLALVWSYLVRKFQKNMRDEYLHVAQPADFSRPFVYFPLSFQPERTTSPQGDMYHDQLLAAETISAALPAGWELYIKEHPSQWWTRTKTTYSSSRYPGYYERLASIPHVRLVPIEESTYRLIDESKTTAVITGTAGWEARLRGKMPLVFGYPWYRDCPGLCIIASVADCKEAFAKLQHGVTSTKEGLLAFIKSFEEVTVRTHLFQEYDERYNVTVAQGTHNMLDVVLEQLRRDTEH